MRKHASILAALVALAGCDSTPPKEPFTYDLAQSTSFDVEANGPEGPVPGVVVSIRTPRSAPTIPGEQLWIGATAADGHARATFRTEQAAGAVEVTLHRAGWRGPWSDTTEQTVEGAFAPSSRINVPLDKASGVHVTLERTPQ